MTDGIGKEFLEKTYYKNLSKSDQSKGMPQPPLEMEADPDKQIIDLPKPEEFKVPKADLRKMIEQRRSVRKYSEDALTLEELAWLLWATQGVKEVTQRPITLRTVPSAGARHAFETIILVNNVEGLQPGLYRYLAIAHKLQEYNLKEGIADKVVEAAYKQSMVKNGAATFIWITDFYRMKYRYGERGYRYIHLDAGHVCQNLHLAAESIDAGVCAIAAFYDEMMNEVLELDGEKLFTVYLAALGKKIK